MSQTGQSQEIKDWNQYEDNQSIKDWNNKITAQMDKVMEEIEQANKTGDTRLAKRLKIKWNDLKDQEVI